MELIASSLDLVISAGSRREQKPENSSGLMYARGKKQIQIDSVAYLGIENLFPWEDFTDTRNIRPKEIPQGAGQK